MWYKKIMNLARSHTTLPLIAATLILFAIGNIVTAQPNIRQAPTDLIKHCTPGKYAQISGNGLECVSTTNTAPPVCSPEIDYYCCGGGEFVKITGQGLQCFSLQDKETTCAHPGETNCCKAYEFGFITTSDGLICAAAPIWDAITQFRIPEKTNFSLDLKNKVLGSPIPTITIGTLPDWIIKQEELLGGKAPSVSGDQTFSFSANAANIAGSAQTNVSVIVQDRSCRAGSDCERFVSYRYCHSQKQECVQCLRDSQCPGSARCVDNTCECGDCPITAPHCNSNTGHTCVECENDSHCPAGKVCSEHTCTPCNTASPKFTVEAGVDTLTVQWETTGGYTYQIQYDLDGSCDGTWQTPSGNITTFTGLTANTTYHLCMRQKAPKCADYSGPATTPATTGDCATSCEASCSVWSPNTQENCSGSTFTQTRTCKNLCDDVSCESTQRASGTAPCDDDENDECTEDSDCSEEEKVCSCGKCTATCNNDDDCDLEELCADSDNRCSDQNTDTQTESVCLPPPSTEDDNGNDDDVCSEKCDEGWYPDPLEVCQGVQFTQQYYTNCTDLEEGDRCDEISRTNFGTKVCRKIPGVCNDNNNNNVVQNNCKQGTPNDEELPDTEFLWRWSCEGVNGGISVPCEKNRPIDGRCNSSRRLSCSRGTSKNIPGEYYRWTCTGAYGGRDVRCSKIGQWTATGEWGECAGGTQSRFVTFECRDGLCNTEKPQATRHHRACTPPVPPPTSSSDNCVPPSCGNTSC